MKESRECQCNRSQEWRDHHDGRSTMKRTHAAFFRQPVHCTVFEIARLSAKFH